MNKEKFISFMQNPENLDKASMDELAYLIKEFPYCQSAHILLTLNHLKEDSILYDSSLKTTAIYASNRRVLKKHIDGLSTNQKSVILHDEGLNEQKTENQESGIKSQKSGDKNQELKAKRKEKRNLASRQARKKKEKRYSGETTDLIIEEEPADKKKSHSLSELKKIVEKRIREIEREKKENSGKVSETKVATTTSSDLIDKFIKDQPVISRNKVDFFNAKKEAASSIVDQENIVSETLANIYIDQGYSEKAKNIYQKLSLKYPEKSIYFAALIKKAEKDNNNKK